jgi:hypothetical protein
MRAFFMAKRGVSDTGWTCGLKTVLSRAIT